MTEEVDVITLEDVRKFESRLKLLEWYEQREVMAQPMIEFATADWGDDAKELAYWRARLALLTWERSNPRP